jgi:SPP1 family predicted phage head-tail adaptor
MDAGQLRSKITIQTATLATDSRGGQTRTWATTATVWGRIEPVTGSELFLQGIEKERRTHRVTMRSRTLDPQLTRLVHDSRTFEIVSIQNPRLTGFDPATWTRREDRGFMTINVREE